jgi:hypothetical protein
MYSIDVNKLKNNELAIKYTKSKKIVTQIPLQHISDELKDIVMDVIEDKYNEKLFKQLKTTDKRLFRRVIKLLGLEKKIHLPAEDDEESAFQQRYEVLLGECSSGNSNKEVKQELKHYVLQALSEGLIKPNDAHQIIVSLC